MYAPHFVRKTDREHLQAVCINGKWLIDQYAAFSQMLVERCGLDVANLFCEPVVTPGNGEAATSIRWYTPLRGDPVPLNELDGDARKRPEADLKRRLDKLAVLLRDPVAGPYVAAALNVASAGDILVIDGKAVLTNWAMLPRGLERQPDQRQAHFSQALGPFANFPPPPLSETAPPLSAAAGELDADTAAPATAAASGAEKVPADTAGGSSGGAGTDSGSELVLEEPWYRRRWVSVAIAVLIAATLLVIFLIPGVLLYPAAIEVARTIDDETALALQRNINGALEEQTREAQRLIEQKVCRAPGGLYIPGSLPPDAPAGTQPPLKKLDPGKGAQVLLPQLTDLVPPLESQPNPSQLQSNLVDLLDLATVLVLALTERDDVELGSGFFVAPDIIVTNNHVVKEANPSKIFVVNKKLQQVRSVELLSATGGKVGSADYAILKLRQSEQMPQLTIAPEAKRLESIIAAGYPAVVMQADINFHKLMEGDASAIPEMAVTQGNVMVVQNMQTGSPIIAHTAPISPGNSGGPLVDTCGRVLGVNTFGLFDETKTYAANYALAAQSLVAFLQQHGVQPQIASGTCQPATVAEASPPAPRQ